MANSGESLCEAAREGDVEKAISLIDSGADVTYFDKEGLTPLMHAANHGHSQVIKALLDAGAPWNALSPSNVSAGDFAMENGHQAAFDLLLNTGIQAELILGTIARKENAKGKSDSDYLADRVNFSEDKVMDSKSKAVMMAWEKPLMEAHAKAICSKGGDMLNIGFGMGLVDTAIQQYAPTSHTIVEAHPEVYNRMLHAGWGEKVNVKIIFGRWQDVLSQLGSFDGIFFDTYGEYYEDMREFHQHLPQLLKPGGIYSFFNGLCGGEEIWEGVKHKYWQLDTYYLPVCQCIEDTE
ncbi:protein arginine N-methyltransferase 2 isoform X3 [Olea europaea var. sylvestris]|uniref:Arginine N-methyltransferase 2 n=1 Tax=Olea europaea subsp. europaea TaxID=158383 RepID=A0A8S0PEW4_OLEEU|nr:protein arginine N-methyltransferase 2 isoform X3 [Olea europaea var. sylvestris]CAA2944874.1 arginine N-methyltransferase 2 [Olea europaea subsp. europaea]